MQSNSPTSFPPTAGRKRLSVCTLTWNSATRLPALLADVARFADELVVGVDEDSGDDTFELACSLADVVFKFEHSGLPDPAYLLPFEYASGDWVLVLDDDERMDGRFPELLPELLGDDRYTHYLFPCKWIASPSEPYLYLCGPPWFPDWHTRLIRNDKRLVWHAPRVHAPYRVAGLGGYEARTSLVHFERAMIDEERRRAKLARYREMGSGGRCEEYYCPGPNALTRLLEYPPPRSSVHLESRRQARVIPQVCDVAGRSGLPPLCARLTAEMPRVLAAGERIVADVLAFNSGELAWYPSSDAWAINVAYHLRAPSRETRVWDGERTRIGQITMPGQSTRILASFIAPKDPGEYLVEWDMVSEGDCWFAECGSLRAEVFVTVVAAHPGAGG